MAMTPLWKMRSGKFAGWHTSDLIYDARGEHIGYLAGHIAHRLDGQVLGEIYQGEWIGQRTSNAYAAGESQPQRDAVAHAPLEDRDGLALEGWNDPAL